MRRGKVELLNHRCMLSGSIKTAVRPQDQKDENSCRLPDPIFLNPRRPFTWVEAGTKTNNSHVKVERVPTANSRIPDGLFGEGPFGR